MLPENARAIMSVPHPSGRAAMRMLEQEGFSGEGYVDIFDGGPTMSVKTDNIRTIREAQTLTVSAIEEDAPGSVKMMLAAGERSRFACGYGHVAIGGGQSAVIDRAAADLIGVAVGDRLLAVGR
jgi:arginine N-succinyltransferase